LRDAVAHASPRMAAKSPVKGGAALKMQDAGDAMDKEFERY